MAFKFKRCNEARNVQRIWRILRARSLVYYVYTIIVSFNHPISRFVTFWHDYASLTSATVSRVLRFCLGFMCLDLCRRNSHSILMLASRNVLQSMLYSFPRGGSLENTIRREFRGIIKRNSLNEWSYFLFFLLHRGKILFNFRKTTDRSIRLTEKNNCANILLN